MNRVQVQDCNEADELMPREYNSLDWNLQWLEDTEEERPVREGGPQFSLSDL